MEHTGRKKEHEMLLKACQAEGFKLLGISGRRGVGKTAFLKNFLKDRRHIFLTAREMTLERNIESFSRLLFKEAGLEDLGMGLSLNNLQNMLSYIGISASRVSAAANRAPSETAAQARPYKDERLTVVIDDFQYLENADPSFMQSFIRGVEYELANKDLVLIISAPSLEGFSGSVGKAGVSLSGSFEIISLAPFDYLASSEFFPGYSNEEKLLAYGVTGGVPGYMSLFDMNRSARQNIASLFFEKRGALYEEPINILRREFRNVGLYNTLLDVIGKGAGRMNEISKGSGYDTPVISPAMKKLIAHGLVRKEIPVLNGDSKRDTSYVISDPLFGFWYGYVSGAVTEVEGGEGSRYFEEKVVPVLNGYLKEVFEKVCREYILLKAESGEIPVKLVRAGKWQSTDQKKNTVRISVAAVDEKESTAVIGECHYRNSSMEPEAVDRCIENGKRINCEISEYYMFSKNGYYPSTLRKYRSDERVKLLTLKDLYPPVSDRTASGQNQ